MTFPSEGYPGIAVDLETLRKGLEDAASSLEAIANPKSVFLDDFRPYAANSAIVARQCLRMADPSIRIFPPGKVESPDQAEPLRVLAAEKFASDCGKRSAEIVDKASRDALLRTDEAGRPLPPCLWCSRVRPGETVASVSSPGVPCDSCREALVAGYLRIADRRRTFGKPVLVDCCACSTFRPGKTPNRVAVCRPESSAYCSECVEIQLAPIRRKP